MRNQGHRIAIVVGSLLLVLGAALALWATHVDTHVVIAGVRHGTGGNGALLLAAGLGVVLAIIGAITLGSAVVTGARQLPTRKCD